MHQHEHPGQAPAPAGPAAHARPHLEHPEHPPPTGGRPPREAMALEHRHVEDYRRRFWICLVLTIPVLFYAETVQDLLNYTAPEFPGSRFVSPVFASAIYFYGGSVFLAGAAAEWRRRSVGMMTLIAIAISVAYAYSVGTEVGLSGAPLYWELATLVDIMLLGHWIEMRAVGRASGALKELARLLPDTAERIANGTVEEVPVEDLRHGDLVLVRPGARVPADGEVTEGESAVNESMITGESRPVRKRPGDEVIGGTVNGQGSLRVRVTKVGEETALGGIMRIVEEAQTSRTRAQALADRAAFWLVLIAIGGGTLTLLAWLVAGEPLSFALERSVTVLVIACPHALGLAIPLVIAISTTLSARNGLLVRDRLALEQARTVDTVVFDKTGTLTRGEQGVVDVATVDAMAADEALALAAAVEGDSEHMIARALRARADEAGVRRPPVSGFEALPGRGVRASVDGRIAAVGGPRLLESLGQEPPTALRRAAERWGAEGKTVVYLLVDEQPRAAFALADVVRPESFQAVAALKEMGIRVAMITGDSEDVARWVAGELGIDEYFAQVLPEHKADRIRELRQRGRRVAMVGDGVNDAPALVTADVGIAIGAGTDVAIESAGIILVRNDPRDVPRIITLSRASYRKMLQNLAWATGYNVVALPLAAGILAPVGILLIPAVGALFMSASTVIVAVNAQLLRRLNLAAA